MNLGFCDAFYSPENTLRKRVSFGRIKSILTPFHLPGPAGFSPSAFTIIELLVVVCIIAILLGVTLTNILPIKEIVKRKTAVIMAKQLEMGYKEYFNNNQHWPPKDNGTLVKGAVLEALFGATGGVAYIEFGTKTADTFFDPWGDGYYQVAFDDNFDNNVTQDEGAPGGATIGKSVIVWNIHSYTNHDQVVTITNRSWE